MVFGFLLAALTVHSAVTNGVSVRWFEERVPMRDGVTLYTYGALPADGARCALVLERNPYVKETPVDGAAYAYGERGNLGLPQTIQSVIVRVGP